MKKYPKFVPVLALASFCSAESITAYIASAGTGEETGILALNFDTKSGELSQIEKVAHTPNPFFLGFSVHFSLLLAAYNLSDKGEPRGHMVSYLVEPETPWLKHISRAESYGKLPPHVSIHPSGYAFTVANYQTPIVSSVQILSDASLIPNDDAQFLEGSSIHPKRQDHSYTHSITFHPSGTYACDRGTDRIYIYNFSAKGLAPSTIPFVSTRPEAGPRHMAFNPDGKRNYVIKEITSSVTAYTIDLETGAFTEGSSYASVPQDFHGENFSAEISLHPNTKYLYASNRGHDSISVF